MNAKILENYCNWHENRSVSITVDIDWAPDYMISDLYELIKEFSPTLHATHESSFLRAVSSDVHIGVHPNLSPRSSHGAGVSEVMDYLKGLGFANLKWSRFHLLNYGYPDLLELRNAGVELDSSYCLLNGPFIVPHLQPGLDMVFAPYFWEDGLRLRANASEAFVNWDCKGLKIFNFHPIDIYFNTPNLEYRRKIKELYPSVGLIPEDEAKKLINNSTYGSRDAAIEILRTIRFRRMYAFSLEELNQSVRGVNHV